MGKKKKLKSVEPGMWVYDKPPAGMPKLSKPKPLEKDKKLMKREIADLVEYEGIGYCVMEYISPEMIKDKQLAKLWGNAQKILRKIIGELQ